jgi:hypothetical protein
MAVTSPSAIDCAVMGDAAVPHVFAYLDPGSASIMFQAILATLIAAPILGFNYIKRGWRSLLRRLPGHREEPGPGDRTQL